MYENTTLSIYHPNFAYKENILYIAQIKGSLSNIPISKLFILFIIPSWCMLQKSKNIFQSDIPLIDSSFVTFFRSKIKNDFSKCNLNDWEKSQEGISGKFLHIWDSMASYILIYEDILYWGRALGRVIIFYLILIIYFIIWIPKIITMYNTKRLYYILEFTAMHIDVKEKTWAL